MCSFSLNSVSGSSDIPEDYSEEQCQEKEGVWGVHWNATTAYIFRGKTGFVLQCEESAACMCSKTIVYRTPLHPQLSERMKVVDVISTKTYSDSQQIIAQVINLFIIWSFFFSAAMEHLRWDAHFCASIDRVI